MPRSIYVATRFKSLPEKTMMITEVLEELAERTRGEPGCISFNFFQCREDPLQFISVEHWQDPEAEAAHWSQPHVSAAMVDLRPALEGDIQRGSYAKLTSDP